MGYYEEMQLNRDNFDTNLSFEKIKKNVSKITGVAPFQANIAYDFVNEQANGYENKIDAIDLLEEPNNKVVMTEEAIKCGIEDAIMKKIPTPYSDPDIDIIDQVAFDEAEAFNQEIKGFVIPDDDIVIFIREKDIYNKVILHIGIDYRKWRRLKSLVKFIDKTIGGNKPFEIVLAGDTTHYGYRWRDGKKYFLTPKMEETERKTSPLKSFLITEESSQEGMNYSENMITKAKDEDEAFKKWLNKYYSPEMISEDHEHAVGDNFGIIHVFNCVEIPNEDYNVLCKYETEI